MIANLFFYFFSFMMIISSILVVSSRNSVHGVLWLIFTFFNAAGIFIILGSEFIASLVVIVYVGAVAVLFLFVIMMLDIKVPQQKSSFWRDVLPSFIVAGVFLVNLILVIKASTLQISIVSRGEYFAPNPDVVTNTQAVGRVLYTDFALQFQLAGLILLVAMVGCIMLTLRKRTGVRRQDKQSQLERNPKDGVRNEAIGFKRGVEGVDYD